MMSIIVIIWFLIYVCSTFTITDSDAGMNNNSGSGSNSNVNIVNVPDEPAFCFMFTVYNEDIFDDGCYEYQSNYEGPLYFSNYIDTDINWNVYIVDEQIEEYNSETLLNMTPTFQNLPDDGVYDIKDGQWIYIYCDHNADTASEPVDSFIECGHFADYI